MVDRQGCPPRGAAFKFDISCKTHDFFQHTIPILGALPHFIGCIRSDSRIFFVEESLKNPVIRLVIMAENTYSCQYVVD